MGKKRRIKAANKKSFVTAKHKFTSTKHRKYFKSNSLETSTVRQNWTTVRPPSNKNNKHKSQSQRSYLTKCGLTVQFKGNQRAKIKKKNNKKYKTKQFKQINSKANKAQNTNKQSNDNANQASVRESFGSFIIRKQIKPKEASQRRLNFMVQIENDIASNQDSPIQRPKINQNRSYSVNATVPNQKQPQIANKQVDDVFNVLMTKSQIQSVFNGQSIVSNTSHISHSNQERKSLNDRFVTNPYF